MSVLDIFIIPDANLILLIFIRMRFILDLFC